MRDDKPLWLRIQQWISHQTAWHIVPTKTTKASYGRFSLTAWELYDLVAVLLSFIFANTHLVTAINSITILTYQAVLCLFKKKSLNYGNNSQSNLPRHSINTLVNWTNIATEILDMLSVMLRGLL